MVAAGLVTCSVEEPVKSQKLLINVSWSAISRVD